MSPFYCREEELKKLNKRYCGGKFECIIIYGRRRVGKTALINEFCKDKPTVFFSALNTTAKENLEALSKSIMSFERPDRQSTPEFPFYDAALDELTELSKEYANFFRLVMQYAADPYNVANDTEKLNVKGRAGRAYLGGQHPGYRRRPRVYAVHAGLLPAKKPERKKTHGTVSMRLILVGHPGLEPGTKRL